MNDAFLDTVGMIAVWDDTDQWHADAQRAYDRLFSRGRKLVTTSAVLCECANASARRTYRSDVCAGIVDHVSFIVMRRLGITDAFTNDRHFQAAGFTTLF